VSAPASAQWSGPGRKSSRNRVCARIHSAAGVAMHHASNASATGPNQRTAIGAEETAKAPMPPIANARRGAAALRVRGATLRVAIITAADIASAKVAVRSRRSTGTESITSWKEGKGGSSLRTLIARGALGLAEFRTFVAENEIGRHPVLA